MDNIVDVKVRTATEGTDGVKDLTQTVVKLGDSLGGEFKAKADAAAAAIEALGAKRDAVVAVRELTNSSGALAIELAEAEHQVEQLAQALPAATAEANRLAAAEQAAREAAQATQRDLDEQRQALAQLGEQFTGAARRSGEYRESSAQLQVTVRELRRDLEAKEKAVKETATQAAAAAQAETALAKQYTAAGTAAVSMRGAVQENTRALEAGRTVLQGLGIQTDQLTVAERNLDAALGQVRQEVAQLVPAYQRAGQQAVASAQAQRQASNSAADGVRSIADQLQRIQQIATIAVGGGFVSGLAKEALATADAFNNLQARIKLVTGEGPVFARSFAEVTEVALRTHSALDQTGMLFGRIAEAGKSAGQSSEVAIASSLRLTETINQAVQLSGATQEASSAAITQLIQGLQSGVLRGDEFNSVMEQAPRLAKALADGLGVTTGELRKMAEAGALTAETVTRSLRSQSEVIKSEFASLPPTVGRAVENLRTKWALYLGDLDKTKGITSTVASAINGLANNLESVVKVAAVAGTIWAGYAVSQGLASAAAKQSAIAAAQQAAASTQAAVATQAHGRAATIAAAEVTRYGAASAGAAAATQAGTAAAAAGGGGFRAIAGGVLGAAARLTMWTTVAYGAWTVLQSVGTALGEGAAKWMGYGDAMKKAEDQAKQQEEVQRVRIALMQDQADRLRAIQEAQFGLSKEASVTSAKFDQLRKDGDSAAEAIGKIGKDFDLQTVKGIADAGAVLDRLVTQGKISAGEFQAAWAEALKGQDLGVFETNARAAFSGSSREAERLAAMLDAGVREAIKRTGLDFNTISGGMSAASRSAINDADAIIRSLDRLKKQGVDVGQALRAGITKSIDTADSQKAIEAVRTQIESVRAQLGDKVTDGFLEQATLKAEELKRVLEDGQQGIQSVGEAFRKFGLETEEDLQRVAKNTKEAYDVLRESGMATAEQLRIAFEETAKAATKANKGVAPSWTNTEREIIRARQRAQASPSAGAGSSGEGIGRSRSSGRAGDEPPMAEDLGLDPRQDRRGQRAGVIGPLEPVQSDLGNTREERLAGQNAVDNRLMFELKDKLEAGTLSPADVEDMRAVVAALKQNNIINGDVSRRNPGAISLEGGADDRAWQNRMRQFQDAIDKFTGGSQGGGVSATVMLDLRTDGGRSKARMDRESADNVVKALRDSRRETGRY